jgi:hypothetical protein
MYGKEDSIDWIDLAQVRDQLRTLVNTVINFLKNRGTVKFSRRSVFMELVT